MLKTGTYKHTLMIAFAIAGEFPYHSMDLVGRNRRMAVRYTKELKDAGFVTVEGKGQLRTVRLTDLGLAILSMTEPKIAAYNAYSTDNRIFYRSKSAEDRLVRRHRNAEVVQMMHMSEIKFLFDEKPDLTELHRPYKLEVSTEDCFYYTSRELKAINEDIGTNTSFTRILGALVAPSGIFPVYNMHQTPMAWEHQGEKRAKIALHSFMTQRFEFQVDNGAEDALMLGQNYEPALQLVKPPEIDGFSAHRKWTTKGRNFELMKLEHAYKHMHFLTMDEVGRKQIQMMCRPYYNDILRDSIFDEDEADHESLSIEGDAFNREEQILSLMFFDGDLTRLKRMAQGAANRKLKTSTPCLKSQVAFLQAVLGDSEKPVYLDDQIFGLFDIED